MTGRPDSFPVRWCFSTLGCADRTLEEVCELAEEFRLPGIELRGLGGRLDMPGYCAELHLHPARVREICQRHHIQLAVAGCSAKLTSASESDRAELLTFGAWADALRIPYLRVFGGGSGDKPMTDSEYDRAVKVICWWRQERAARQWEVDLLLETHDAFSASEPCLSLNQRLDEPLQLLWDSHHTWRMGSESPAETWKRLGPLIRHVHVKDSVGRPSARHPYTYVLPGEGEMPLSEVLTVLRRPAFQGFVSLEWERQWHPYLPPLRQALVRLSEQSWFAPSPNELFTANS